MQSLFMFVRSFPIFSVSAIETVLALVNFNCALDSFLKIMHAYFVLTKQVCIWNFNAQIYLKCVRGILGNWPVCITWDAMNRTGTHASHYNIYIPRCCFLVTCKWYKTSYIWRMNRRKIIFRKIRYKQKGSYQKQIWWSFRLIIRFLLMMQLFLVNKRN